MYGQGNYAPQFRHGPPPPPLQQAPPGHPAPFQQTPPGLPPPAIQHGPPPNPQIHQAPSGLPSVPYQHAPPAPPAQPPLHFPPPPSVNMGQPYIHPHESAQMFPSYALPGTSYHPPMLSQNAHQVPQQMPPPPRMFPPPPPPPPSQGQILYRTSPPPPLGVQHVPTPPPPPPSSFVSITPAPFVPFGSTSLGDAHPPSLPPPPPPPPPSSPPPLSPSPTPPAPPMVELPTAPEAPSVGSGADVTHSFKHVPTDAPVTSAQSADNAPVSGTSHIGEVDNAGKKVPLVEKEVSGDLPPPPPKPIEEEVARNIEVLCQFIAKVGPEFERLARTKEAGNPKFAFLFGGAPGSAAAVGYEYFQWLKGKYRFEIESHKDPERLSEMEDTLQSGNFENEVAVSSPSTSDMDMEDDVGLPDGDAGFIKLNTEPTGEFASLSNGRHVFEETAPRSTTEHVQEGAVPSTASCSGPSSFLQDKREDDKDSSFIEDVSPVRPLLGSAECAVDGNMQQSERPLTQDSSWVNVMPTAACGKTAETPRVFVKDGSPFRLIQGYASDDSGEDDDKKDYVDSINPVKTSPSAAVGRSGLQKDKGYEMPSNFSPKSVPETERSRLCTDSSRSLSPMCKEAATFGSSSPQNSPKPDVVFLNPVDAIENVTDLSIHKQHDQRLHDKSGNHEPAEDSDVVGDKSINVDNQVTQIHTKDAKQDSTAPNVDEFGRLVREGVSDSDSDGIHYNERHGNRVRSWSRSRSPQQSRWRQRSRSPRRRDKRSRSRSWSPRRRSKSPLAYRRTTLFARADRDQPPECLNFIRGRCFRGASCRFLHRDVGYHRRRQPHFKDFAQGSDNYDVQDDALVSENCYRAKSLVRNMDVEKHDDVDLEATKSPKMQIDEKLSKASTKITHDGVLDKKVTVDAVTADALPSLKNDAGKRQITDHDSQNIVSQVKEPQQMEILQKAPKINGAEEERTQPLLESSQPSPTKKSECLISETVLGQPNTEGQAIQAGAFQNQVPSIQPYSELAIVSQTCQSQSSVSHSHSNCGVASQPWNQRLLPGEFSSPRVSVPDTKSQPSQLLPLASQGHPPPFFPVDSTTAPCASEHPRENLLPPVTSYHLHRPPLDKLTSHQPPVASDYHSQSMHPSNSMWPNPPLPPPSYVSGLPSRPAFPAMEFLRVPFQQNTIPPRNDFSQPSIRPYPPGELARSQAVDFHHQPFQPMESSHHPPLHMDEFNWRPLPMGNQQNQPFPREDWLSCPPSMPEGSRIISDLQQKEYHLHHQSLIHDDVRIPFPGRGPSSSKSYSQGSAVFPPALSNQSESFPGDRLPPRFFSKEEFPSVSNLPYSHPPYGQQRSASPNFPLNLGGPSMTNPSLQRLSSSFSESNLPRQLSDIGAPNMSISTHYNPFASTFEEAPGSLQFGSDKYDTLFSSSHDPLGGSGSRLKASPPNLRRSGEQFLPRSGGYSHETSAEALPDAHNQFVRDPASGVPYDPLFDSIETSSNMLKKLDRVQEQNLAADDAGMVPKINSLTRPADVEDSNRQKDSIGAELKSEVDEFGEVATDAEVGAVENESPQQVDGKNWSPVIPHEVGNTAAGEIEIDQVRSPGKKKSKESRSMKLLKIALADFVKEVLKPSWRQGNMSKEAFKTIVKKTVDKVSGAIPSHQIPKTQAKINQYVESSQRKLTKLVMAYVDKYVKM